MLAQARDYVDALQHPKSAFRDAELQESIVEKDLLGLPLAYTGTFTTTFRLKHNSTEWAVRCFTRPIDRIAERYGAIARYLDRAQHPYFARVKYDEKGIHVNGSWYPIVKMEWVNGLTLNDFVDASLGERAKLEQLANEFLLLTDKLHELQIAHGDLQHGNIIIGENGIRLVDYDGLYVEELSEGYEAADVGHENYQHPKRRQQDFDPSLDRFSSIVIYVALRALAQDSTLWKRFDDGENLLFVRNDFVDLKRPIYNTIEELGDDKLAEFAASIKKVARFPDIEGVPTLPAFIKNDFLDRSIAPIAVAPASTTYELPPMSPEVAEKDRRFLVVLLVALGAIALFLWIIAHVR
jgi:serine/threonine protein kinase